MKIKITWLKSGFIQVMELVQYKCQFKNNYGFFSMYSPIYEAIESGTFCIDLGYGKHHFKAEELAKNP